MLFRAALSYLLRKWESPTSQNQAIVRWFYSRRGNKRSFHWNTRQSPRYTLFALATGFSFKENGIPDKKLKSVEEAELEFDEEHEHKTGWEILVDEQDFRAYRRRLKGSAELYEYRCAGSYYDISPRHFLDAQNNLGYRTEWDRNIISLELVAEEDDHELLRWISKFPYPMSAREYVYVRRTCISNDERIVIVESEVVPERLVPTLHPDVNVRVATYNSRMVIRAHGEWEEPGVDYILTYSDNPEANIPRYIFTWIVNQGGPYFLKQVHEAALHIQSTGREVGSVMRKFRQRKEIKLIGEEKKKEEQPEVKMEEGQPEETEKATRRANTEVIPAVEKKPMDEATMTSQLHAS